MNKTETMIVELNTIQITQPAFITLVIGLTTAILISFFDLFTGLSIFLVFLIASYNVNCVEVGHCQTWARMIVAFYIIYIVYVVMVFSTK